MALPASPDLVAIAVRPTPEDAAAAFPTPEAAGAFHAAATSAGPRARTG